MVFLNPKWQELAADIRTKARESSNTHTSERFLAIALLKEGRPPPEVAVVNGRHYATIMRWITRYNDGGIDALVYRAPKGRDLWLSKEQLEQLKAAVQQNPTISGLTGIQWTYKQVIEFCDKNFRVLPKERTAQKYLRLLGFVRRRPKQAYARATVEKKQHLSNI